MKAISCTALVFVFAAGCASGGAAPINTPGTAGPVASAQTPNQWVIKTREHVDLWLHGFAMLQEDTARVPLFRRGYRDEIVVRKNRENTRTLLDSNRTRLVARLTQNRQLGNAQFAALYFGSWDEMREAIDIFLRSEGDPRRASSQGTQQIIAFFAQQFPSPADREWLRVFSESLLDEQRKFYHAWWVEQQRARAATLTAIDSGFRTVWLPKFRTFLANTQQSGGDLIPSIVLAGEGRTVNVSKQQNVTAVGFPSSPANAAELAYVFAHEVIGTIASTALTDNTTPAELRSGAGERLQSNAAVRGGALLLEKVAPELVPGYQRYYLSIVNAAAGSDASSSFAAAFPISEAVRDAIRRQLDIILGGI